MELSPFTLFDTNISSPVFGKLVFPANLLQIGGAHVTSEPLLHKDIATTKKGKTSNN